MTFAVLCALHAIVGEALDDIQAIYAAAPVDLDPDPDTPSSSSTSFPLPPPHLSFSPPTDPDLASHPRQSQSQRKSAGSTNEPAGLDFPALDDPGDPHAPAELLTAHPDVANAISRIVSAAGHMAAVVRAPFLTLCDAGMGYHLPSCLRFLETAHIPELLREAGTGGLHAREISARIGVESVKTSHILRLLATHHLLRELRPDVFALNRISGLLDSGKSFDELQIHPEDKYDGIGGKAAFVALNTDELFKASAYLTDFLLPHRVPDEQMITKTLLPLSPSSSLPTSPTPDPNNKTPSIASSAFLPLLTPNASQTPNTSATSSRPASPPYVVPAPALAQVQAPARLAPAPVIRRLLSRPKLKISKSRNASPVGGSGGSPCSPSVPDNCPRSPSFPNKSPRSPSIPNKSPRSPHMNMAPRTPTTPPTPNKPLPPTPIRMGGKSPGRSPGHASGASGSGMWLMRRVEPAVGGTDEAEKAGEDEESNQKAIPTDEPHPQAVDADNVGTPNAAARETPPPQTAFNLSQRTRSSFWAWLEAPGNEARLKRFGRAMGGSEAWEGDGEGLGAHPFPGLPPDALVVDVGGGIGSSTMRLAGMFPRLRFVVQDRAAVCRIGEEAWRARCPELIEGGRVKFQVHDFFTPQPIRAPAVFLVRVVCHDWPDALARRMLLQLRRAAREFGDGEGEEGTYLVIGDHVLPYAVAGGGGEGDVGDGGEQGEGGCLKGIEGARDVQTLRGAKWPLLANLGKASANAYWMDLTMQVTFNGQERTLPELVALAASAGWRIVRVAGTEGSLFGHIVAVPGPIPGKEGGADEEETRDAEGVVVPKTSAEGGDADADEDEDEGERGAEIGRRMSMRSRTSTPALDMFGSPPELPYAYGPVARKEGRKGAWMRWVRGRASAKERERERGGVGAKEGGRERERVVLERVDEHERAGEGSGEYVRSQTQRVEGPATVGNGREGRGLFKKVSQMFGEGGS